MSKEGMIAPTQNGRCCPLRHDVVKGCLMTCNNIVHCSSGILPFDCKVFPSGRERCQDGRDDRGRGGQEAIRHCDRRSRPGRHRWTCRLWRRRSCCWCGSAGVRLDARGQGLVLYRVRVLSGVIYLQLSLRIARWAKSRKVGARLLSRQRKRPRISMLNTWVWARPLCRQSLSLKRPRLPAGHWQRSGTGSTNAIG